ncbi:MAG: response regulator transcription factor [Akkermansiaceae bacterium]
MLSKIDWQEMDAMILKLHQIHDADSFETYVLESLSKFLGAQFASWNIHNADMYLVRVANTASYNERIGPLVPALNQTLPTHPLFPTYMDFETGKVQIVDTVERVRDHISEADFYELPFYKEVARKLNIEDQLLMHITIKNGEGILLTFHSNREFTQAEHLKASIMRGHILARHHTLASKSNDMHERALETQKDLTSLLTVREMEAMRYLCLGMSNSEIGWEMKVSEKTINKFVSSILKKLSIDSRTRVIAQYSAFL